MLAFDELNVLNGQKKPRSIPINRWFNEMPLSEQQRRDRRGFAKEMQDILFVAMSMIHLSLQRGMSLDDAKNNLAGQLNGLLNRYTYPDGFLTMHIAEYVSNFVDTTVRHSVAEKPEDVAYWFSEDRARFNAENETNLIFNHDDFRIAVASGLLNKQWITMRDERVRYSHTMVDGEVIPIEDYFLVGESLMLYPMDTSMGADDSEICNCRCVVRYF